MLSLLQDVIYLESKGQKPTPKHYCLGVMLHHFNGSSKVIGILNKLGHFSTRLTISSLETALAQLQANRGDSNISAGFVTAYTTLVWNNIDFNEETKSGKGTTHHTSGIFIQKIVDTSPQIFEDSDRTPPPKRQHILKSKPVQILPYRKKKRTGPIIAAASSVVESSQGLCDFSLNPSHNFTTYVFLKTFDEYRSIPTWTGYNTLLCRNCELLQDKIGYLPMIPASPTRYDTVYTILQRSLSIADDLLLPTITLVFDMAIYIKAQDILWTNNSIFCRTVVLLGEFHTCMTFLAVIGKRFSDAGLFDILIESEIVALESVHAVLEGRHYNRGMSAHKVVAKALEHLRFEAYFNSFNEIIQKKMCDFAKSLLPLFPSKMFLDVLLGPRLQSYLMITRSFVKNNNAILPRLLYGTHTLLWFRLCWILSAAPELPIGKVICLRGPT